MITSRVVYLSPTYYPYRIPVFDALHRRLGDGFTVVSMRTIGKIRDETGMQRNAELGLAGGEFPRRHVRGRHILLRPAARRGKATPFGITIAPSLPFVLASIKPQVVISINFNLWTLLSLVMGYRTIIFWEGWSHTERTVTSLQKALRRYMTAHASGFVANGELSREYLLALGAPAGRIFVPGMCGSTPPALYRDSSSDPRGERDRVRFLFVGRLEARKGVTHLLHATAHLRRLVGSSTPFEVVIVGDGPERPELERLTGQLDIAGHIQFTGYTPPDEIWMHYARSDVLVLPTLQDNWPLVVPEAMSVGLPILLSKYAGSVPDLIDEGGNGHLFDPADHPQMARLMAQYIKQPEVIRSQSIRSLKLVAPYTPERVADTFIQAIAAAMSA